MLIKRGLASGTELTKDNAETDYTLGGAYATFRARDLNEGVTIKPYIEIDGNRQYGEQGTYKYSDLT